MARKNMFDDQPPAPSPTPADQTAATDPPPAAARPSQQDQAVPQPPVNEDMRGKGFGCGCILWPTAIVFMLGGFVIVLGLFARAFGADVPGYEVVDPLFRSFGTTVFNWVGGSGARLGYFVAAISLLWLATGVTSALIVTTVANQFRK